MKTINDFVEGNSTTRISERDRKLHIEAERIKQARKIQIKQEGLRMVQKANKWAKTVDPDTEFKNFSI